MHLVAGGIAAGMARATRGTSPPRQASRSHTPDRAAGRGAQPSNATLTPPLPFATQPCAVTHNLVIRADGGLAVRSPPHQPPHLIHAKEHLAARDGCGATAPLPLSPRCRLAGGTHEHSPID